MSFTASEFTTKQGLKADEVKAKGPYRAEITGARIATFEKDGKNERKPELLLRVNGEERSLILNKTNLAILAGTFGDASAGWIGKMIGLVHDPAVSYGGKLIGGIRVKVPTARPPAQPVVPLAPADDPFGGDDDLV